MMMNTFSKSNSTGQQKMMSHSIVLPGFSGPIPSLMIQEENKFVSVMKKSVAIVLIQRWWKKLADPDGYRRHRFFTAAEWGYVTIITSCLEARQDPDEVYRADEHGLNRTALQIAAGAGHHEVVRILLESGAQATIMDINFNSALHYACMNAQSYFDSLKQQGGGWKVAYSTGIVPHGCIDAAAYIIGKQPRTMQMQNKDGQTALHLCCSYGLHETAEVLCAAEINADARDNLERTALHLACWRGDIECTRVLLEHKPELKAANKVGRTPLHVAALYGHTKIVTMLIQAKAELDVVNHNFNTPLLCACLDGFFETAGVLIDAGASVHLSNKFGETPLAIAIQKDLGTAAKMLDLRREVTKQPALFGDLIDVTYNFKGLDQLASKTLHCVTHPSLGMLHPDSPAAIEFTGDQQQQTEVSPFDTFMGTNTPKTNVSGGDSSPRAMSTSKSNFFDSSFTPRLGFGLSSTMQTNDWKLSTSTSLQPGDGTPRPSSAMKSRGTFGGFMQRMRTNSHSNIPVPKPVVVDKPSSPRKQVGNCSLTPVQLGVFSENPDFASHPVLVELLTLKWKKFAKRVFMKSLIQHTLLTLCWTIVTLFWDGFLEADDESNRYRMDGTDFYEEGGLIQAFFIWTTFATLFYLCYMNLQHCATDHTREPGFRGFVKACITRVKTDFWWGYDVVPSLSIVPLLFLVHLFCIIPMSSSKPKWVWEAGRVLSAMLCFLLWSRFMQFLMVARRTGPFVKIIIVMFQKDLRNFMSVYVVFLFAFSHAFHVLLNGLFPATSAQYTNHPAYDSPIVAVLATFRMMVGDFTNLYEMYEDIDSLVVLIFMVALFVAYMLLAKVLMLNLLIAMLDETWGAHKRLMEKEWRLGWAKRVLAIQQTLGDSALVRDIPERHSMKEHPKKAITQAAVVEEKLAKLEETMHMMTKDASATLEGIMRKVDQIASDIQHIKEHQLTHVPLMPQLRHYDSRLSSRSGSRMNLLRDSSQDVLDLPSTLSHPHPQMNAFTRNKLAKWMESLDPQKKEALGALVNEVKSIMDNNYRTDTVAQSPKR